MDFILYLLVLIIPLIAQINITSSYNRGKQIKNNKGLSGFEVAKKILDANGLSNIYIVEVKGNLTDHYDPTKKVIRLSSDIFHGTTIAAASVASHEVGHAIQDNVNYKWMRIRTSICPVVNFITYAAYVLFILSIIIQFIGGILFAAAMVFTSLLFQLVTLPVEFDASNRALKNLKELDLVEQNQLEESNKVLKAAAMTYVAAVLSSILNLIRILLNTSRD